jgi:hypothetical protein
MCSFIELMFDERTVPATCYGRAHMSRVRVGKRDASTVGELLQVIGQDRGAAGDVRANAAYWAGAMQRIMERGDLQTVAWVLFEASEDKAMSSSRRRNARYWSAKLEARV